MDAHLPIKKGLVKHLKGGEAYLPLEKLLDEIPFSQLEKRPAGLPYSFYELFYHIRYAQKDILDYCSQIDYQAPKWPLDYWPNSRHPESEASWQELNSLYLKRGKSW